MAQPSYNNPTYSPEDRHRSLMPHHDDGLQTVPPPTEYYGSPPNQSASDRGMIWSPTNFAGNRTSYPSGQEREGLQFVPDNKYPQSPATTVATPYQETQDKQYEGARVAGVPEGRRNDPAPKKKRRICGFSLPVFILVGIILLLLAALGGAIGGLIAKNNKDKKSDPGIPPLPAISQQPDLSSDSFYFIKAPLFLHDDNPVLSPLPDKQFANATRKSKADIHSHFQFQRLPDTHIASAAYRRFFNISAPFYLLKNGGYASDMALHVEHQQGKDMAEFWIWMAPADESRSEQWWYFDNCSNQGYCNMKNAWMGTDWGLHIYTPYAYLNRTKGDEILNVHMGIKDSPAERTWAVEVVEDVVSA